MCKIHVQPQERHHIAQLLLTDISCSHMATFKEMVHGCQWGGFSPSIESTFYIHRKVFQKNIAAKHCVSINAAHHFQHTHERKKYPIFEVMRLCDDFKADFDDLVHLILVERHRKSDSINRKTFAESKDLIAI